MDLILVCGALLCLLVACLFQYHISTRKPCLLPPGRSGWLQLIRESLEYLSDVKKVQSERFYLKRMAKYSSSVFTTSFYGDPLLAVFCGVEGCKFLFTNAKKFIARRSIFSVRKLLFDCDDKEFEAAFDTCFKPALLAFLKGDALSKSVGVMDTIAQRHVESWNSQEIKMYPLVRKCLFALAIRLFLLIEDPEIVEKMFHNMEILSAGFTSIPIDIPGTSMNRAIKASAILKSQILSVVKQHRLVLSESNSCAQNSLLSLFLLAHDDDDLVTHGIFMMIVGGYDSSSSVMCMTLKVLSDYPQLYLTVFQENMEVAAMKRKGEGLNRDDTLKMKNTWNVVREVLRLYTPVPFITRECIADFTFAGFQIPKGYTLMASSCMLHKDPKYFEDPEQFNPSRFEGYGPLPYTYIPFGGGSFMCPGKTYAQQAILVFIHNVVIRFKWESIIQNEKVVGSPHPRPFKGFPVYLHPLAN